MKIILLAPVAKLGKRGDVKEVADGYARNFLFPRKLAEPATQSALARIAKRKQKEFAEERMRSERERMLAEKLSHFMVVISTKSKGGKLFGAVRPREIVAALADYGIVDILEEWIVMDKPLKEIGEYILKAKLDGREVPFTVVVEGKERG